MRQIFFMEENLLRCNRVEFSSIRVRSLRFSQINFRSDENCRDLRNVVCDLWSPLVLDGIVRGFIDC